MEVGLGKLRVSVRRFSFLEEEFRSGPCTEVRSIWSIRVAIVFRAVIFGIQV